MFFKESCSERMFAAGLYRATTIIPCDLLSTVAIPSSCVLFQIIYTAIIKVKQCRQAQKNNIRIYGDNV